MSKDLPTIIVPARLSSIRFPRKLLQKIDGIPLIIHTAKRIKEIAPEFDSVFAVECTRHLNIYVWRVYIARHCQTDSFVFCFDRKCFTG